MIWGPNDLMTFKWIRWTGAPWWCFYRVYHILMRVSKLSLKSGTWLLIDQVISRVTFATTTGGCFYCNVEITTNISLHLNCLFHVSPNRTKWEEIIFKVRENDVINTGVCLRNNCSTEFISSIKTLYNVHQWWACLYCTILYCSVLYITVRTCLLVSCLIWIREACKVENKCFFVILDELKNWKFQLFLQLWRLP